MEFQFNGKSYEVEANEIDDFEIFEAGAVEPVMYDYELYLRAESVVLDNYISRAEALSDQLQDR